MNAPSSPAPHSDPKQEAAYLSRLGDRVRAWRGGNGMTRKALAAASSVSERYLAQLEAGQGNISVLLLRKVARAMGVTVESLVRESAEEPAALRRIALLGLRGAGKSSLGAKLAASLGRARGRRQAGRSVRDVRPGGLPAFRAPRAGARAARK